MQILSTLRSFSLLKAVMYITSVFLKFCKKNPIFMMFLPPENRILNPLNIFQSLVDLTFLNANTQNLKIIFLLKTAQITSIFL